MTAYRRITTTIAYFCLLLAGLLIGCKAAQAEESWTRLDGPQAPGGVIQGLAVAPSQPQTIYGLVQHPVGLRLYRSNDRALSWTHVYTFATSQMQEETIFYGKRLAVAPDNPEILYTTLGNQLLASETGGIQWRTALTMGQEVVAPAPKTVYVVGMRESADVDACPNKMLTFAGSVDSGIQWYYSDLGCDTNISSLAVAPSQSKKIYVALTHSNTREYLMVSEDGGKSWIGRHPMLGGNGLLAVDPTDAQHILWGGGSTLAESKDSGQTWRYVGHSGLPIPLGYPSLPVFASDGTLYVVGERRNNVGKYENVLLRSDDAGESWWEALNPLLAFPSAFAVPPDDPDSLYIGYRGRGIYSSANRGSLWKERNEGISSPVAVDALAAPADDQMLLVGAIWYRGFTREGLFGSVDGGDTWRTILTDTSISDIVVHPQMESALAIGSGDLYSAYEDKWYPAFLEQIDVYAIALSAEDTNVRILGGMRPISEYGRQGVIGIWHTGGPGTIPGWQIIDLEGMYNVSAVAIHPQHPAEMYAAAYRTDGEGRIFRSSDGGATWRQISDQPEGSAPLLRSERLIIKGDNLYSLSENGELLVSEDYGEKWRWWSKKTVDGNIGNTVDMAFDDAGQIFVAAERGVYFWDRRQALWQPFGLENRAVYDLLITGKESGQTIYAATDFGVWKRSVPKMEPLLVWFPHIQNESALNIYQRKD